MWLYQGCEENDAVKRLPIRHQHAVKFQNMCLNIDYHEIILVILWNQASKEDSLEILRDRRTPLGDKSKWDSFFLLSIFTIQSDLQFSVSSIH